MKLTVAFVSSSSPVVRSSDRSDDSSFISKMKKSNSQVVVFYGSQTGTAEEFSGRIAKEATKYGLKVGILQSRYCIS